MKPGSRRTAFGRIAVLLLLGAALHAAGAETKGRRSGSERALAAAKETAAALAKFPEPPGEYDDSFLELPPEAERLLQLLHRRLAAWAIGWLDENRDAVGNFGPEEIQARLSARLRAAGLADDPEKAASDGAAPSDARWFGTVRRLSFQRPHPESLPRHFVLTIVLDSGFVEDASLLVLELGPRRFRPVLEWSTEVALTLQPLAKNDPFQRDVRKGLNELHYRISPPDADGRFFVFVLSRQPGYPSNWGQLSWAILRTGAAARTPKVLLRDSAGQRNCDENCFEASVSAETLTLAYTGRAPFFHVLAGFDQDGYERRWRVFPDRAEEDGAPTRDARDLVELWTSAPWEKVRRWSDGGNERLAGWHAALTAARSEAVPLESGRSFFDACPPHETRTVVELVASAEIEVPPDGPDERGSEKARRARSFFVLVASGDRGLVVVDVTRHAPSGPGWIALSSCP